MYPVIRVLAVRTNPPEVAFQPDGVYSVLPFIVITPPG